MQNSLRYRWVIFFSLIISTFLFSAFKPNKSYELHSKSFSIFLPNDTTNKDTTYKKSKRPVYKQRDTRSDPIVQEPEKSPLLLGAPSNVKTEVELDSTMEYVTIYQKVGDEDYRAPTRMPYDEFVKLQNQSLARNYWRTKAKGSDAEGDLSSGDLIPPIPLGPTFGRIFGGDYVDIRPNGSIALSFGGRWQRTDNPSIPIRQQRNGNFDFDQQISFNLLGKIGERLRINANWDTKATFDFENNIKVEYQAQEEDIIQSVEAGNVSMPLPTTLISGAQNLFGVKTQLQFGRLSLTAVASNQRGAADQIDLKGGAQTREFEIPASDYEDNRHYFLSQFFRDNFERAMNNLPQVNSGVQVTRVEVYVTNRTQNTEDLRNIVAFQDLGEANPYRTGNPRLSPVSNLPQARNGANGLYNNLTNEGNALRNTDLADNLLTGARFNFVNGEDYELINSARQLDPSDFTVHRDLGYISLNVPMRNDEVLAVSYEYTLNGQVYKVGELTEDYQSLNDNQAIILKLLRPTNIRTDLPMWDLMMKNIYSLNASQISQQDFRLRVVYRDDVTGVDNPSLHEGQNLTDKPLVRVFGADRLNRNNDPAADGNFDYVENLTVDSRRGRIIFPVLEPFGDHLEDQFTDQEEGLIQKYVFVALYDSTKADAQLQSDKDKFFITGQFQSSNSNTIRLPGLNISRGSVRVTAGTQPLTEGVDYTVDYNIGVVRIINEGILASGRDIKVDYERADLFNFQQKSLVGMRADFQLNEDVRFGATLMHLNERPLISRVNIGNEPLRNTMYGVDFNYQDESRVLTKAVDLLPVIQTKAPSSVNIQGEFAQLLPGSPRQLGPTGTSFIDDFEGAETPIDLGRQLALWRLASVPQRIEGANAQLNDLSYNYRRAKLAWYTIDNVFYAQQNRNKPEQITDEDLSYHYVRPIPPQEVFRNRDLNAVNINEFTFDLAYFPSERGPYNYNPNVNLAPNNNAVLLDGDPSRNFAGIQRAITFNTDFDNANVEYIEFWMMDPFIEGERGRVRDGVFNQIERSDGKLYINLGSVSEDIMKDNKHAFENGLPIDGDPEDTDENNWGRVTKQTFLNNAFDNSDGARENQDIGLDGLDSNGETSFFADYLNSVPPAVAQFVQNDPSNDDFRYYLGNVNDDNNFKIIERYKDFNGYENNSPDNTESNLPFVPSFTNLPDNEDINQDNTLNDLESYYEYEIPIEDGMDVGDPYIVDKVDVEGQNMTWYQFRIPIRENPRRVGGINDFKSIRFIRMYMTEFEDPVVLRFLNFQLVSTQWRRYLGDLNGINLIENQEPSPTEFTITSVNIEENGSPEAGITPYQLPPGVRRDQDNFSQVSRRLNEQSMSLCVDELKKDDARAVFKNTQMNMLFYKRLQMYVHAEAAEEATRDGDLSVFLRMGTDFAENYYEIEVPLTMTPPGTTDPNVIWPRQNEIDIRLQELIDVKTNRNKRFSRAYQQVYSETGKGALGNTIISVKGNPDYSDVRTFMIGIRNTTGDGDFDPKSGCVWVNELRVTEFDKRAGWAATGLAQVQLADLATVSASGLYSTVGFGNLQDQISERATDYTEKYDIQTNIQLDKLIPGETGIKLPMYVAYESEVIRPNWDPRDPDVPLDQSLETFEEGEERDEYEETVIDRRTRRSINFQNVRKEKVKKDAKPHFYDVSNFNLDYAYSEERRTSYEIQSFIDRRQSGGLGYNYAPNIGPIEPFKKVKFLDKDYLELVKSINFTPLPNSLTFRGQLTRQFRREQFRSGDLSTFNIEPYFDKTFYFDRNYALNWNITKSIGINYSANVHATVDEPFGELDTDQKRDSVWNNVARLGRTLNYDQTLGINYSVPFDKFPLTNWVSADVRYQANYNWIAGSLQTADSLGNDITNSREQSVNGRINLTRLYNKVPLLKKINSPTPRKPPPKKESEQDSTEKEPREWKGLKEFAKVLMSVKSVNVSYRLTEGTAIPGFNRKPTYFGLERGTLAPGLPFVLGSQDPNIRFNAADNDWIATSASLNQPFSQNITENLNLRTSIEPFKDVRIQLDATRTKSGTYSEIFRFDSARGDYVSLSPVRNGSFSISIVSVRTAFIPDNEDNTNPVFTQFEQNRSIIRNRLERNNPNLSNGAYGENSQDVLVPAFFAAYTGQSANDVSLSPFPQIPIPNWRLDYGGLARLKPFKKRFTNISISHAYNSSYNVGGYTSSLNYDASFIGLDKLYNYPYASLPGTNGELVPVYIMNGVTITERFSPLVGVNVRTKSNLTVRVDYKRDRSLSLNLANSQVTEVRGQDVTIDLGFTKKGLELGFLKYFNKMEPVILKNEVNARASFTIRDSKTIQRKIEDIHTVTAGNLIIQLRPTVSYNFSRRLNAQLFFERNINSPRISSSFRTSNTSFGVQLRFSLAG